MATEPRASDRAFGWWLFLAVALVTTLPYLWLHTWAARNDRTFVWLLYNLPDGLSYYAKMRQGLEGSWRFRLPYTADAAPSAYLFLYYLALGHLARVTGLSLPAVFHLARVAGIGALVAALGRWLQALPMTAAKRRLAWFWVMLAVGMEPWVFLLGIIALLAEASPFLSSLLNPHFPLTLALMLLALHPRWPERLRSRSWRAALPLALLGAGLAVLAPFAVVVVGTTWVLLALGEGLTRRPGRAWRAPLTMAVAFGLGALPYMAYGYWAVQTDPYLRSWNAQNQTPLYPWPAMLALFAPWWWGLRTGLRAPRRWAVPLAWFLAAWGWALLPLNLQRRMLTGALIPLVALTVAGWPENRLKQRSLAFVALVAGSWLFYLLGPVLRSEAFVSNTLSRADVAALAWLNAQPADGRVLTGPDMGLFVPAYTHQRVFYGHKFESVPAQEEKAWVLRVLCSPDGDWAQAEMRRRRVRWVLWTAREDALCPKPRWLAAQPPVWAMDEVTVYAVPADD